MKPTRSIPFARLVEQERWALANMPVYVVGDVCTINGVQYVVEDVIYDEVRMRRVGPPVLEAEVRGSASEEDER